MSLNQANGMILFIQDNFFSTGNQLLSLRKGGVTEKIVAEHYGYPSDGFHYRGEELEVCLTSTYLFFIDKRLDNRDNWSDIYKRSDSTDIWEDKNVKDKSYELRRFFYYFDPCNYDYILYGFNYEPLHYLDEDSETTNRRITLSYNGDDGIAVVTTDYYIALSRYTIRLCIDDFNYRGSFDMSNEMHDSCYTICKREVEKFKSKMMQLQQSKSIDTQCEINIVLNVVDEWVKTLHNDEGQWNERTSQRELHRNHPIFKIGIRDEMFNGWYLKNKISMECL